ncbi:hypothetical protein Dimus_014653 [Dionaea muscipula]
MSSALIPHLKLNSCCCISSLPRNSNPAPRIFTRIDPTRSRRPTLSVPPSGRRRIARSAIEDLKGNDQQLGGSGVGSVLKDRPDDIDFPNGSGQLQEVDAEAGRTALYDFLYPSKELLPEDKEMSIFDHLEELRQRIFVSVLAVGAAILGCFAFSKELIILLEAPVKTQGVRFLQLAPGEFFFTTLKVPVIQLLLGQTRLVTADQMLSIWRYVVVGAVVAAAVLTPSTDPLTQMLLAGPLLGLYLGGAWAVKLMGR